MDAVRRYRMDGGADFYTQLKFLQRNRPDSGAVRLGDMGTTESNLDPAIKIFHLITSLEVGGEQHGLLINIQGMSKRNFRPIVCSVMDKVPMSGQFEQIGIPVHSLGLRGKYDPRVYWRLWRLLRRERPDILHTHLIHANLLGRIIGRLAGVPAIVASEVTVGRPRRFGTLANRLTNRLIDIAVYTGVSSTTN